MGKFRHILLTGKNGSGKTTILNHLSHVLDYHRNSKLGITSHGNMLRKRLKDAPEADRKEIQKSIQDLENVQVGFQSGDSGKPICSKR
ncbi:MAG: AAA family ATPase [Acidobacteria bacterium]|nr:AAA family ATPase [Acidobacteriota bacterium]